MEDHVLKGLIRFYDAYRDRLEANGKLSTESVLTSALKVKNNERFRPLKDSAIQGHKIPATILSELKEKGLVRNCDDVSSFVITGKGIWVAEKQKSIITDDKLIQFIDENYFANLFVDAKPLSDKEKVVVFTLLAARAYSEDSAVDMKKDDSVKEAWKELLVLCSQKLRSMGVIEETAEDLFPKDSNYEDPASHLIRHTDKLPRKTKALFRAKGRNRYFLEVCRDAEIDPEKIGYLFWLVFQEKLDPKNVDEVFDFCKRIAYDYSIKVFDFEKHRFSSPKYDDSTRSGIVEAVVSRQKWESSS